MYLCGSGPAVPADRCAGPAEAAAAEAAAGRRGETASPADRKFVPSVVTSAVLLVLPLLVYFKPYVSAVLEACAVLGLHITLRERLGGEKD